MFKNQIYKKKIFLDFEKDYKWIWGKIKLYVMN